MHCQCGQPFTRTAVLAGRTIRYWCRACDEHGVGCTDREHQPGKCTYRQAAAG